MKKKNLILIGVVSIFFLMIIISAENFGYNYLDNEEAGLTNVSMEYVNSSNFWDDLDVPLDAWISTFNSSYFVGIDTNASTECEDGEYLDGSSACIHFNDTVGNLIDATYHNPTQAVALIGNIDAGTLANIQHSDAKYDGVTFNFSEVVGGLDLRINFTGLDVDTFSRGIMRYYTSSLKGDFPLVQMWSYGDGAWEDYPSLVESETFAIMTQPVFDGANHIQDGVAQMRIYKPASGNTNNHYYVDWVAIVSGGGLPVGEEVDPVFNVWLHNASLKSNLNGEIYNITSNWFKGLFNWTVLTNWFSWDGATLGFNETKLNATIDARASGVEDIWVNGTEAVHIDSKYNQNLNLTGNLDVGGGVLFVNESAGRVGINTAIPVTALTIVESGVTPEAPVVGVATKMVSMQGDGASYYHGKDVTNDIEFLMGTSASGGVFAGAMTSHDFWLRTDNVNRMTILKSSGYVGIGTETPEAQFHSKGPNYPTALFERTSTVTDAGRSAIGVRHTTSGNMADGFGSGFTFQIKDAASSVKPIGYIGAKRDGADETGGVGISTYSAGTINWDQLWVDNDGNVGIGTTTPTYPLEVVGNISDGGKIISIWADSNISATGYITRTSVFDKSENPWDYIKDANYYKKDEKIEHSKFYGYAGEFEITDYSRPMYRNITDDEGKKSVEVFYPYKKFEEGIELGAEIDVLRQALAEIKSCTEKSINWGEYKNCINKV